MINKKKLSDMTKVSIVLKSHLNDLKTAIENNMGDNTEILTRIEFINLVIHNFPSTNVWVSDEAFDNLWKMASERINPSVDTNRVSCSNCGVPALDFIVTTDSHVVCEDCICFFPDLKK